MPLTQIVGGFERKNSRVTIALSNLPKVGHICVSEITPPPASSASPPKVIRCQTSLNSLIYGTHFRNYVRVTNSDLRCLYPDFSMQPSSANIVNSGHAESAFCSSSFPIELGSHIDDFCHCLDFGVGCIRQQTWGN